MRLLPLAPLFLPLLVFAQDPNPYYVALLNDSMWFYEAQRSGTLPSNNRVSWRSDSALSDGSDHNIDLTGGYYDAGDYLKFTLPLAHSIALLAWGGIEWYDGYVKANQTAYLRNTVRWGTDWLIKAHPEDDVLYVQVGDGEIDNDYWGPDTDIPLPRPSYMISADAPGTDVAGQTAAAFAASSYLFRYRLNDTNYADLLQTHAEALFDFAESAMPLQVYTEVVPASEDYYADSSYSSQLVYAALWLYRATGNPTYQDKASDYFDSGKLGGLTGPAMDWSDQTGSIYVLGSTVDRSTEKYSQSAVQYLDALATASSDSCSFTSGGLLWCDGQSETNSLVIALDTAFLALLYNDKVDRSKTTYSQFGLQQLDYTLGNNRMLTPYVCGVHMNSPQNPHHAGASDGTDIGDIDHSPPVEAHTLYGAIVGGPDKKDKFYDERDDWAQTEVALDYNAPFQGLLAYQLSQTSVDDPPYVSITQPRPYVSRSEGLAKWLIAVIVIVVVFFVAGVCFVSWWKRNAIRSICCGARQRNKETHV